MGRKKFIKIDDKRTKRLGNFFSMVGKLEGVTSDYLSQQVYVNGKCCHAFSTTRMIGWFIENGEIELRMSEKAEEYFRYLGREVTHPEYKYDFCEIYDCPRCEKKAKLYGENDIEDHKTEKFEIRKLMNGDDEAKSYFVQCPECGFGSACSDDTKNEAIKRWRQFVEEYKCRKVMGVYEMD